MQQEITLQIPNPKLWSPNSPHLYELEVSAGEDQVSSYFGMRKFSLEGGHLCLNGAPLFQFGPLDQGYWPDGLYTPPTDEAMRQDIEIGKGTGLQHASQTRQGGTEALLLLLRPDWVDRLAGYAERQ